MHSNRPRIIGLGLALVSGVALTAQDPGTFVPATPATNPSGTGAPAGGSASFDTGGGTTGTSPGATAGSGGTAGAGATSGTAPAPAPGTTTGTTPAPAPGTTTGTTPAPGTTPATPPPPDPAPAAAPAADPFTVVLSGPDGDYPLQHLHKVLIRQLAPASGTLFQRQSRFTIVKDEDPGDASTFADLRAALAPGGMAAAKAGSGVTATLTLNQAGSGQTGGIAKSAGGPGASTVINLGGLTGIRVRLRGDHDDGDDADDADDAGDAVPQERIEITFQTLDFGAAGQVKEIKQAMF